VTRALDALLGESPRMAALRADVERLLARWHGAGRLPPILILGETGTGKGLLARTLHEAGPRRAAPFVAVNCAALPDTLIEDELFGHVRGAFTGAHQAKAGLFQAAHGGTLFLDEIGLLPRALQAKLLTVLEDRAVRRLGATRAEPVDVALVAATGVDLKQAIAEGQFREDLYHRLAVVSFELPPLRARAGDILQLAEHFLAGACADYGLPARALAADARERLLRHRWPGNVRELGNMMERAALLTAGGEITAAMLNLDVVPPGDDAPKDTAAVPGSLDDALRERIESGLRAAGGSIRQAAVALGISRNTLRGRMDKYGLRQHAAVPSPASRAAPVAEGAEPAEWKSRHLAVLRVRLVAAPTVDAARALMEFVDKIHGFGGQLEDSSPTGVVAVFGLEPVENAPSHAALAALAIHGAAARMGAAPNRPLDSVIAIDGGHHLVRQQGPRFEIAADGKATMRSVPDDRVGAERPGAIWVTDAIVPFLTRGFALERLPDAGGGAWLLGKREAAAVAWSPFVGRSAEVATLLDAGALAARGRAQVVGIVGEAGVGKSRLLQETARRLQGWRVLSGGCAPYAVKTPYFPLAEILRSFCEVQDNDSADEVRAKISRSVPPAAGDPAWLLPALFDLLGVLPTDDALRSLDPPLRRRRTHDALRQLFLAAGAVQRLCLIVENLEWIDAASQEVLDRLVHGTGEARLLLLVTYRPEVRHAWGHESSFRQVPLEALPGQEAGEMLDALLGADPGLDPLKQRLAGHGNPLLLEETVRALVETKALEGARGHYRPTRPLDALEVPATVQAILAARIERLASEDRRLLQIASVVGKVVPLALLQAVAERPEEALRRGLEALEAAEFLRETGRPPALAYSFKHALTHEVTYGTLTPARRQALHARIVGAIERAHPDRLTEHVERLAHHALRGEMWEAAVGYLHEAGLRALTRSANQEATEDFEQALWALGHRPETRATMEQGVDLRFELRAALFPLGELDRILALLREAEDLARRLGDRRRLGQFHARMCHVLRLAGDPTEAVRSGESAHDVAESLGDVGLQVTASISLGAACLWTGDYRRAEDLLLRVLPLLEGDLIRDRLGFSGLPAVMARAHLTWVLADQGKFEPGIAHGQQGIRLAETLDHPYSLATICWYLAHLHLTRGEPRHAIGLLERAAEIARTWNLSDTSEGCAASLGYAYALVGRTDEGLPMIEHAMRGFEATGHRFARAFFLVPLGEACALAGRPTDALEFAGRALTLAREGGRRSGEASALRLLGDLSARLDQAERGERHYLDALALAAQLGMRPLVAHCHAGLGGLYRRAGRHPMAQHHVDEAATMYREMGMPFEVTSAEATEGRPTEDRGT
jgi:transcriptional regulator with AAA-type ATPase domain/tetratricopeptide (TPR) repeat protein